MHQRIIAKQYLAFPGEYQGSVPGAEKGYPRGPSECPHISMCLDNSLYIYCPCILHNSSPFHSQKYPGLVSKLLDHPSHEVSARKKLVDKLVSRKLRGLRAGGLRAQFNVK